MSALEVFFPDVSKGLTVLGLLTLILSVFLHEPHSKLKIRASFALGIAGTTVYIMLINTALNAAVDSVSWIYPFVTSFLFAAPPAMWIAMRGETNWRPGMWLVHFFPALLAAVFRSLRFLLDEELLMKDVHAFVDYRLDYPGNVLYLKTYVIYLLTFVSACYYLVLARFTQTRKESRIYLALMALLALFLFYPYILRDHWLQWKPNHLALVLVIETLAVAYSFYLIVERYRGMFQTEKEVNDESLPDVLEDDTFGKYLVDTFHGEMHFLRDDYSMDMLSSDSGHSPAAWRAYFKSKDTTFLIVKKRMRIDHATQLILEGYLDNHTVEALTSEIGYSSRSTFYSAFQEIKGMPFPQYVQQLRKS